MGINANLDVLGQDVTDRILSFKKRKEDNKKRAARVVLFASVISAITTILIGASTIIGDNLNKILTLLALVTSTSLSVIHTWDGLFNHKKLWINYADALNKLYELETDIRHLRTNTEAILQEDVNNLYFKYKYILNETNEKWVELRIRSEGEKAATGNQGKSNAN